MFMFSKFTRAVSQKRQLFTKLIMDQFKTIGTHDGVFHCDEVLGCAMLRILNPNAIITRTRDLSKLADCDIVIDVGGVYDPLKFRFDHHQRDFDHSMSTIIPGKKFSIKLSSAGLVYCHFGKDIIRGVLKDVKDCDVEKLFDKVYENFLQEIDGIDNGIPICDGEVRYNISTNLSSRVSNLNKRWNEEQFNEENAFSNAMEMAISEFKDRIVYYHQAWLPARDIVLQAINDRFSVHPSGEIITLSQQCPWKGHFFELEAELEIEPKIKFVLFDGGNLWRVQAVPLDEKSFILRIPLMEAWRGLRDEELAKVSSLDGIKFVHYSGFIGGHISKEGALEMAVRTVAAST